MRTCASLSVILIVAFASPVLGASQGPAPPPWPTNQRLRIVTDGAKNPERIPDRAAISMFLSAIAIPLDADKKAVASMEVMVAPMALGRGDMALLRVELAGLHERLLVQREVVSAANLEAQRVKTTEAAAKAIEAVEARRTLAVESYGRLLEILSPEGRKKLVAHIAVVKSQMKAFDFPR